MMKERVTWVSAVYASIQVTRAISVQYVIAIVSVRSSGLDAFPYLKGSRSQLS